MLSLSPHGEVESMLSATDCLLWSVFSCSSLVTRISQGSVVLNDACHHIHVIAGEIFLYLLVISPLWLDPCYSSLLLAYDIILCHIHTSRHGYNMAMAQTDQPPKSGRFLSQKI